MSSLYANISKLKTVKTSKSATENVSVAYGYSSNIQGGKKGYILSNSHLLKPNLERTDLPYRFNLSTIKSNNLNSNSHCESWMYASNSVSSRTLIDTCLVY